MPNTTVIITHYDNPQSMMLRAASSVYKQTVHPDLRFTGKESNPYYSWYNAIMAATTEYVAILHDDDWYEPTFIERCEAAMTVHCGFVFAEATVHYADETTANFPEVIDGYLKSEILSSELRKSGAIVSPSCVLLRREDALQTLLPGGVPLAARNDVWSGPDMLLTVLLLLKYPCACFIRDALVNFSAHEGSTTMKSDKGKLKDNYDIAWRFFDAVKGTM